MVRACGFYDRSPERMGGGHCLAQMCMLSVRMGTHGRALDLSLRQGCIVSQSSEGAVRDAVSGTAGTLIHWAPVCLFST